MKRKETLKKKEVEKTLDRARCWKASVKEMIKCVERCSDVCDEKQILELRSIILRRQGKYPAAMDILMKVQEKNQKKSIEIFEDSLNLPDVTKLQQGETPIDQPLHMRPRKRVKQWVQILKETKYFKDLHEREVSARTVDTDCGLLDEVAQCVRAVDLPAGTRIFSQGDKGHVFYVIYHGIITISQNQKKRYDPLVIKTLGPGEAFGEVALHARFKQKYNDLEGSSKGTEIVQQNCRTAHAIAKSRCILLMLQRHDYIRLTEQVKTMEYEERRRWLRQCPGFESLSDAIIERLVASVIVKLWNADDLVLREDDPVNELYVIKSGVVDLYKGLSFSASTGKVSTRVHTPKKASLPKVYKNQVKCWQPEPPGAWIVETNWRDTSPSHIRQTQPKNQILVGVLGRGQVFGETVVLQSFAPRSPVSAVALTSISVYAIPFRVIDELKLQFNLHLVNFLNASMDLHNPPLRKLSQAERNRHSWHYAKDDVLASVMSKRWLSARKNGRILGSSPKSNERSTSTMQPTLEERLRSLHTKPLTNLGRRRPSGLEPPVPVSSSHMDHRRYENETGFIPSSPLTDTSISSDNYSCLLGDDQSKKSQGGCSR